MLLEIQAPFKSTCDRVYPRKVIYQGAQESTLLYKYIIREI